MKIREILRNSKYYPKNLRNIHTPPERLFVNGSFAEQDEMAVAIVGSRRASPYGLETSERIAYDLAMRGITVVSGMARGRNIGTFILILWLMRLPPWKHARQLPYSKGDLLHLPKKRYGSY